MTIKTKMYEHHGDDFAHIQYSTSMAAEDAECPDEDLKRRVVDHVEATELMLGVVATPSLDADDRYHQFVFEIARVMDGLIFDGNEFLDPEGTTLIEL